MEHKPLVHQMIYEDLAFGTFFIISLMKSQHYTIVRNIHFMHFLCIKCMNVIFVGYNIISSILSC